MSIKNATKLFLGSVIVYVATASCVALGDDAASQLASGGHGSAMTDGGSGGIGGMGGIMDPIPDANAEPYADGTRLKFQYWKGSDGSRIGTLSFYDTKLQAQCLIQLAGDGTYRCMPLSMGVEPWSQYVEFELTHD